MTDGQNQKLGAYVETSAAGERVRAYVPAPLPPQPPLELGRFMQVYERAVAAVGRLDGVTTILPSTPMFWDSPVLVDSELAWLITRPLRVFGFVAPRI